MLNVGIVGAENSHTAAIARVLNVERKIAGVRVTHLWGEKGSLARRVAADGRIPHTVERPDDLIGSVDAAVVDHRHGKFHLPAARPLLEAGMPLFIDKPFCYRKAEGKRFLSRARQLGVPVCSFSVLPKQASFAALARKMRSLGRIYTVVSTGTCDVNSRWGGIFFYGIHQVDMVLRLAGYEVGQVQSVSGTGKNHAAHLFFRDGAVATMNLVGAGDAPFHLSVVGSKGRVDQFIEFDESIYLAGIRDFVRVFRSGRTRETVQTMLGPVAVLEALEKSMVLRRKVRVSI